MSDPKTEQQGGERALEPEAGRPGNRGHRRHLRNYLLDKRLQLRYVALITALSALIAGALGYLIYRQEHRASNTIMESLESSELAGYSAELKGQIQERLSSHDNNLVLTMVGAGVGLALVLSLYVVVMTHKVAGPLYKVSGYLASLAEGRMRNVTPLRKGDMLQDFYESFRHAHDTVKERYRKDNEAIGRFLVACDDAGVGASGDIGDALRALREHKEQRDRALG